MKGVSFISTFVYYGMTHKNCFFFGVVMLNRIVIGDTDTLVATVVYLYSNVLAASEGQQMGRNAGSKFSAWLSLWVAMWKLQYSRIERKRRDEKPILWFGWVETAQLRVGIFTSGSNNIRHKRGKIIQDFFCLKKFQSKTCTYCM